MCILTSAAVRGAAPFACPERGAADADLAAQFLALATVLPRLEGPATLRSELAGALAQLPGVATATLGLVEAPAPVPSADWMRTIGAAGQSFGWLALDLSDPIRFAPVVEPLERFLALLGQELRSRARLSRALTAEEQRRRLLVRLSDRLADREQEHRRLAEIARRTHNGVIVTDRAGKVTWVNDSFTRITGYPLEALIGRSPGAILQGRDTDPAAVSVMSQAIARGESCRVEILNYTKDGRGLWLDIEIVPLRNGCGALDGFVAIEADITAKKQAMAALTRAKQDAEAANRAKSAFLAQMSHELRTPLNGILGFSEMLVSCADRLSPDKRQAYASDIHEAGSHLLHLLTDLLTLSAVEAGRMQLTCAATDAAPAAKEALRGFRATIEQRRIRVVCEGLDHLPPVRADHRALVQIFYNLISNALKHAPTGGRIGLIANAGPDRVGFSVIDDGPGLPPDKLEGLFQPFATISNPHLTRPSGAGLGLSIVRGLVTAQDGTVQAGASRWGGARICFSLPCAESPVADMSTAAATAALDAL